MTTQRAALEYLEQHDEKFAYLAKQIWDAP